MLGAYATEGVSVLGQMALSGTLPLPPAGALPLQAHCRWLIWSAGTWDDVSQTSPTPGRQVLDASVWLPSSLTAQPLSYNACQPPASLLLDSCLVHQFSNSWWKLLSCYLDQPHTSCWDIYDNKVPCITLLQQKI